MCQHYNTLKNTGDHEMVAFKLLVPGKSVTKWITPYTRTRLVEGKQYDGGKLDIKYAKKRKSIGKGYFHCYATYMDALRARRSAVNGAIFLIVKCIVPKNTAYYEGTYYYDGYDAKTLAVRSIILDRVVLDKEDAKM